MGNPPPDHRHKRLPQFKLVLQHVGASQPSTLRRSRGETGQEHFSSPNPNTKQQVIDMSSAGSEEETASATSDY